jgi:hypothetical protein
MTQNVKIMAFLLILFTAPLRGQVWEHQHSWSNEWELQYSQWVASKEVHKKIFTDKSSPFFGIQADCADNIYALRIIFSSINSLPFSLVQNRYVPRGLKLRKKGNPANKKLPTLSNLTKKFNHFKNPRERLVAFINEVGDQRGTYHMGLMDTYPIDLKSVRPGDIFSYDLTLKGKTLRHVVIVKNVHDTGTFDFLYSTQRIMNNNIGFFRGWRKSPRELKLKLEQDIKFLPKRSTHGFRRFIWPRHTFTKPRNYPKAYQYNRGQFKLAKKLGPKKFFQYVKQLHKKVDEDPNRLLSRKLGAVCELAQERIKAVKEAYSLIKRRGGKCLSYREYDIHSTPLLDKVIKQNINSLLYSWEYVTKNTLDPKLKNLVTDFMNFKSGPDLKEFCPLNIGKDMVLTLGDMFKRMRKNQLSSDPHDSLLLRWGEPGKKQKRCKRYYHAGI